MSKQKRRRRRQTQPALTTEQRLAVAERMNARHQQREVRRERYAAMLLSCVEGEHYGSCHCQRSQLTRWERAELTRMNTGKAEPRYSLPDGAYEARRLWCYLDA
jgi:hypothetical protein